MDEIIKVNDMNDLAERLREDPALYAYIAADRIEELEHRMSEKDFLPVLRAQAEIIEEQRQRIEELESAIKAKQEGMNILEGYVLLDLR